MRQQLISAVAWFGVAALALIGCMDLSAPGGDEGAGGESWENGKLAAQYWDTPQEIRAAFTGTCLDADTNGGGGNGNRVIMWGCSGAINQKWTMHQVQTNEGPAMQVVNLWAGRCLDQGNATNNDYYTPPPYPNCSGGVCNENLFWHDLSLWDCHPPGNELVNQAFYQNDQGGGNHQVWSRKILNTWGGLGWTQDWRSYCLNRKGGGAYDGQVVGVYYGGNKNDSYFCNHENELWYWP